MIDKYYITTDEFKNLFESLELSYQFVQRETKKRIKGNNTPSNLRDRHLLQTPIDLCYIGFEQIFEKLQCDLKILCRIWFGSQKFYDELFQNLDSTTLSEVEKINDRDTIGDHYRAAMLRWFYLELAHILEGNIRAIKTPRSNIESFEKALRKSIKAENCRHCFDTIISIAKEKFDDHIPIIRYLDQLNTPAFNEYISFIKILLNIRNASHNLFYYLGEEKTIKAFNKEFKFIPGEIVKASLLDIPYFLEHGIGVIKQLEREISLPGTNNWSE